MGWLFKGKDTELTKQEAENKLKASLREKIAAYEEENRKQPAAVEKPMNTAFSVKPVLSDQPPLSGLMDKNIQSDFVRLMTLRQSRIGYAPVKYNDANKQFDYKWPKMIGFGEHSFKDIKNGRVPIEAVECILIPKSLQLFDGTDSCVVESNNQLPEKKRGNTPTTLMRMLTNLGKIDFFDPANYRRLNKVFEQLDNNNSTRWCDADTRTYITQASYTPDTYLFSVKQTQPLVGGKLLVIGETEKKRQEIGTEGDAAVYESDIVPTWFILTQDPGLASNKAVNLTNGVEFSGFGVAPPPFLLAAVNKTGLRQGAL